MGSRDVVINQSIEVEVRARIEWSDPPMFLREPDEDPREVVELTGVEETDEHLLQYALEHELLSEDDLGLQAIEAHDEMCRYEIEMDGYRLAGRRMLAVAHELEAEADKLRVKITTMGQGEAARRENSKRANRRDELIMQARAIRNAYARVSDWRAHEERKARGIFREPHEIEAALTGQEEADDPVSEARLFVALQTSDRVRKMLGRPELDPGASSGA